MIALAHLSPENNIPSLAYSEVKYALEAAGRGEVKVVVADREFSVRLPDAGGVTC